jgi:hypothetical protein
MHIPVAVPVIRLPNRPGVVLAAAIFGIVIVSLITSVAWTMTELDTKVTTNRVDAATALRLAHTAETHAIAVLRTRMKDTTSNRILTGFDNASNTSDDGLLDGYPTLGDSLDIGDTGRLVADVGTYFVRVTDDPAEKDNQPFKDSNKRLRIICRGVTLKGATAEINVIVGNFALPAIAVDGTLEISSKPTVSGPCGGVHANGDVHGGGEATVSMTASATGSVTVDVKGTTASNVPVLEIPDLNPADFCGSASYVYIGSGSPNFSSGTWRPTSANIQEGKTYCVDGNVEFQEDLGSSGSPRTASVIAAGSIKLGGKKVFLKTSHPDGVVLMGGGDLDLQGGAGFTGLVYAGGQAYISDKPSIDGQFLVKNKQPHAGTNYFDRWGGNQGMLISGDAKFTFDCTSMLTSRYGVLAWYPTLGS